MQTLIYSSSATGILGTCLVIYMVWFEPTETTGKILLTLFVLFVVQIVAYLVLRDVQEESNGKKDGTIAQ